MNTTAQQVTTTDQNTGRPVVWNIEETYPLSEAAKANSKTPWTHWLALTRPNGRGAVYTAWATLDESGEVVKCGRAVRI